jgi:Tfp pilus assembly protein PilZ
MKTKKDYVPKFLIYFSKVWMCFPLVYLFYSVLVLGLKSSDILKIILSPLYWFTSFVSLIAGIGLIRVEWYGWYLFVFSNVLIFYQTASILTYYSNSEYKFLAFLFTTLLQLILIYFVTKKVRVPYFLPKIRWWESDPRYRLSVSVSIQREDGSNFEGEIIDISVGGCFIKAYSNFAINEKIKLKFKLFEDNFDFNAVVVWNTESRVTHPKGIGVKFLDQNKKKILLLKKATEKLQKLNRIYSEQTRERNWKEYLKSEQLYQGKITKNKK